jgi:negative regulator of flagellin synthesis FlgM
MSYVNGIGNPQQALNSITSPVATPELKAPASTDAANESAASANVEHTDQMNLSSAGGLVAQALESSDTRTAKVASLQQAISAGTYSVSSSDVADKIIQSLVE